MKGPALADDVAPVAEPRTPVAEPRSGRLNVASLRRAIYVRMWGGKGCGAACDFCRVLVTASDVEYEVEAQLDGETVMLHFHPRCHDAWKVGQDPHHPPPPEGPTPGAA